MQEKAAVGVETREKKLAENFAADVIASLAICLPNWLLDNWILVCDANIFVQYSFAFN